jgi:hypothetical protein
MRRRPPIICTACSRRRRNHEQAPFIVIDGRLYRWKDILELRRAQLAAAGAAEATGALCNLARRPPPARRAHGIRAISATGLVRTSGRSNASTAYTSRATKVTAKSVVAAPIAQGLRDQKNLILRQRFASRFRHPPTFEHDRFKLNRSCSFSIDGAPAVTRA